MATKEEIEQAKQEAKDAKMAPKIEDAYNKSTTNTPAAPKPAPAAPKKLAGGGYVRAADGCVQRGKTRGTMV